MKLQKNILVIILAGFSFLTMIGCGDSGGGGSKSSNNPNDYYMDQASGQCRSRKDHSWVEQSKCNGTNGYYNNNGYRLVGNVCVDQFNNIAPTQSYCSNSMYDLGYNNNNFNNGFNNYNNYNNGYYYNSGAYMYGSVQMDPTAALIGAAAMGLMLWAM